MKDGSALMVAAAIVSALAWAFWSYLGENAFNVLSTTMIIVLAADNTRLRRRLRTHANHDETS
jgi:hypothetical protein